MLSSCTNLKCCWWWMSGSATPTSSLKQDQKKTRNISFCICVLNEIKCETDGVSPVRLVDSRIRVSQVNSAGETRPLNNTQTHTTWRTQGQDCLQTGGDRQELVRPHFNKHIKHFTDRQPLRIQDRNTKVIKVKNKPDIKKSEFDLIHIFVSISPTVVHLFLLTPSLTLCINDRSSHNQGG